MSQPKSTTHSTSARPCSTADNIVVASDRARELRGLGSEIRRRNHETFFSGVANQAYPINRDIGGRWFDETLHGSDTFENLAPPAVAPV